MATLVQVELSGRAAQCTDQFFTWPAQLAMQAGSGPRLAYCSDCTAAQLSPYRTSCARTRRGLCSHPRVTAW